MRSTLTIGQVAKATGINAKTIRYYEEAGVAPPPQRSQSGYRMYSETDVRRFDLIRRARSLDMTLSEMSNWQSWQVAEGATYFKNNFRK